MDTKMLEAALAALLDGNVETLDEGLLENGGDFDGDELPSLTGCRTYQDAGVLTSDAGLVLRMSDGSEFQLTLVRSA